MFPNVIEIHLLSFKLIYSNHKCEAHGGTNFFFVLPVITLPFQPVCMIVMFKNGNERGPGCLIF